MRPREKLIELKKNLQSFISENRALTVYWLLITGLLLYQHSLGWNWDFLVYLMNGEYIFHSGHFMEWLRPPVAPVIMGMLQFIFSRNISGYIFIILASTLFLYSANKFSEAYKLDKLTFYVLMLTPAAISFSTREGTEMLGIAFLMLFLSDLERTRSGIWLGLTVLTRYTYGFLLPLVLLQKDIKKITKTIILTGVVGLTWMTYSFFVSGDPLTSPVSFIALNVLLRDQSNPLRPVHFIQMLFPSILTVALIYRDKIREKIIEDLKISRTTVPLLYISLCTTIIYLSSGITHLRYLYALTLPVAYYGAVMWEEVEHEKLIYLFMGVNLVLGFSMATTSGYENPQTYRNAEKVLDDCMVESDSWPPLNYAGVRATHPVNSNVTVERLKEGWRVLDFTGKVIDTKEEKETAEMIKDMGAYKIYGIPGRCAEPRNIDSTRIDEYNLAHNTSYTPTEFMIDFLRGGLKN